MRRIALVGIVARTTAEAYWNTIAAETIKLRGSEAFPSILLQGFNANKYADLLAAGLWPSAIETLIDESLGAKNLGAEGLLICGSELNPAASELRRALGLPVIDLPFAVGETVRSFRFRSIGLVGPTSPRVEAMWRDGLGGVEVVLPEPSDRAWLSENLARISSGDPVAPIWTQRCQRIMAAFVRQGANAVVMENHLLARWMKAQESPLLPQIDAATVHAWAGALWALHVDPLSAPPCVFAEA